MSTKPHFNVVIATPGNTFTQGYVGSLLKTTVALTSEGLTWTFLNQGGSFVSMVREMTIAGPGTNDKDVNKPFNGEFTYDKIMWIDSDIEWEPSDFFKLYNSEKDIVSGCYLMADRSVPVYSEYRGGMMTEQELLSRSEPFKVFGTGFGFICVKSGVFENMPRPWFGPVSIPVDESKSNHTDNRLLLIGEDLSWCTKAINSGFDIWVDPVVRVIHQKTFSIYWLDEIERMRVQSIQQQQQTQREITKE